MTRLKQYRKARIMSQREVAELVGLSQAEISNIERGVWRPRTPVKRMLEQIFGVPIYVLLADVDTDSDATEVTPLRTDPPRKITDVDSI
jgi:transcriptional regulator with XRE-family HTH domain